MRIVIVGAGSVGSYLAQRLSLEGQDVVVIESDPKRAADMQDKLDALVIAANGASPAALEEAGAGSADLLIAVSNSDGVNLLASHAASHLGAKRTVARVEEPGLQAGMRGLNVDVVIDPAESAADELVHLVQQGGVSELVEFGEGQLVLVGATAQPASPILSANLASLRSEVSEFDWVVAAVVRGSQTIVANGGTQVDAEDHVLMMVTAGHVEDAANLLGLRKREVSRVVILGSTHLAELTADAMVEEGIDVVIVDPDVVRCREIAEKHAKALVIEGDLSDPQTLSALGLGSRDAVLALSGWDEQNIVGCLLSRELGAAFTASRVNRQSLIPLLSGIGIDATISSRLAAASAILRFVRRGRIHSVATFEDTDAEAIELEVAPHSAAAGRRIVDLDLPSRAVIGGILRNGDSFVPSGLSEIEAGDHLIIFALPKALATVEALFSE